MKTSALALAALLSFSLGTGAAHADAPAKPHIDPAKEKDIRHLLQLTGAAAIGVQVMTQMMETFKTAMPNVPAAFWADFAKEVNADELAELVVGVYDRQLTGPEIKDMIKFYETPTGKKLIKVMPAIAQDSMAVGREWGATINQRIMAKLRKQGLDKK